MNKLILNFSIPSIPSVAIVSATFPKSLETLYAFCNNFLFSLSPEYAIANASITVFSAIPSLSVPSKIFKIKLASNGFASFNKLDIYLIFISCDLIPSNFAILNNVSYTRSTVMFSIRNVVWVFCSRIIAAACPKSPLFVYSSSIFLIAIPDDFDIALIANFSATPNSMPSKSGLNFPWIRYTIFEITSWGVFSNNSTKNCVNSNLFLVDSIFSKDSAKTEYSIICF